MQKLPAQDVHIVVFDVNVFLDVADLLGRSFNWEDFSAVAATHINGPCPDPTDSRIDSLRSLALCTSGALTPNGPAVEVWTSSHIDHLIVHKLSQSADGPTPELTGFGWDLTDAEDFLDQLVYGLVFDTSHGGTVGEVLIPTGHPPLSYEDGLVFRTAIEAGDQASGRLLKYCVTNDREFRKAEPNLSSEVLILYPYEWVLFVRQARTKAAVGRMLPRQ